MRLRLMIYTDIVNWGLTESQYTAYLIVLCIMVAVDVIYFVVPNTIQSTLS